MSSSSRSLISLKSAARVGRQATRFERRIEALGGGEDLKGARSKENGEPL